MNCNPNHRRMALQALALLVISSLASCARTAPAAAPAVDAAFLARHGIRYELLVRCEPRPLRIHHLRIDLRHPGIELVAGLADDPDGAGPATASLEPPMSIAQRTQAIVLVNANPWQSTLDEHGQRTTNWREGLPVEALGLSATQGRVRSQPLEGHCAFWLDGAGRAHVGAPPRMEDVREAVAGFVQIIEGGRLLPAPGGPIHPRTALGLDSSGRWLHLAVVDGRQSGYSEGMSLLELATLMKELGCHDAVNLDGGGSSIMILADSAGRRHVVNDPSTKQNGVSVARPIPVALVVRARKS